MSVLGNFVVLQPEVPKRLHFTAFRIFPKPTPDPELKAVKVVNTLELTVDEEDGKPVSTVYDVQAEKHARDLFPYLANQSFLNFDFIITEHGSGRQTTYTTRIEPRKK